MENVEITINIDQSCLKIRMLQQKWVGQHFFHSINKYTKKTNQQRSRKLNVNIAWRCVGLYYNNTSTSGRRNNVNEVR